MSKVYVIGGYAIDILGFSNAKIIQKDSNIGKVVYSFGGVGRNIVENLALLKCNTSFVSVISSDSWGKQLNLQLAEYGVEYKYSIESSCPSATYLAIMDENQDMDVAVMDMSILDDMSVEQIDKVFANCNLEDILVLDTNLNTNMIEYIVSNSPVKIFLDPISTNKVGKVSSVLKDIYFFKPNKYEAEKLSNIKLDDTDNYKKCLDYFIDSGIKEIVISMGSKGLIASDGDNYFSVKHDVFPMINATGAGDSFMSGYIRGYLNNESFIDRIKFAIGCSIMAISSKDTVNRDISQTNVESIINTMTFEVKKL